MELYMHKVKYYETDQMKVVHHSNYIRWMEEARIDFSNQIGFSYKLCEELGIVSPVLSVECKYISPAHFDDEVAIKVILNSYNGLKMSFKYEMYKDSELIAEGMSFHCFLKDNKIISLKRELPKLDEIFNNLINNK